MGECRDLWVSHCFAFFLGLLVLLFSLAVLFKLTVTPEQLSEHGNNFKVQLVSSYKDRTRGTRLSTTAVQLKWYSL